MKICSGLYPDIVIYISSPVGFMFQLGIPSIFPDIMAFTQMIWRFANDNQDATMNCPMISRILPDQPVGYL